MANLFSIDNGKITYNKVSSNELNSITNKKKKLEELKNSYKNANQIVNNDIQKIGNYLNRNGQNVNKNNPFQANVVSNAMINTNKKNLNGRVTLQDVVQDHSNLLNSEKGQELKNNLRISKNERAWSEYNYNQEKVNNEETTLADKTIGTVTRGVKDLFSNMTDSRDIVDDKGKTTRLPSYNELKQNKVSQDYKTGIGKFLGDASYNISKIGASTLMNIPTLGVGGSAIYWSDMYFDSYNSAKNQGYSEDKAFSYALANTGFEYIVGKFLGSATKGLTGGQTSELSNAISNGVNKLISNPKIANIIGNAGSEATEEFIQEYLDNINKLVTLNGSKNPKDYIDVLLSKDILKDAFYSAGVGAVSGGVLQGINNNEGKYAQYNTNLLKSFKNQLEISKSNLTDKETIAKYDSVINDINDYISKPFGNESKVEKTLPTVYDIVVQEKNSATASNENIPIRRYQYVETGNTKIDNLRKSASQYFNDSNTTKDMLNVIEKVIDDKNYNVVFDNTITNKNGKEVNAQITTNSKNEVEIRLNPNSPQVAEFLIVHEVTHAVETDSMKKLIIDYASKHNDFAQAVESLKQTYGTNDVSSEVIADISGQLFGNQEFINNLSMEQPSIFKRIYNAIISLANKITGNSKESLFIKDLKNKWETAYRNTITEQAVNNLGNEIKTSEKLGGYVPDINVTTNEISKYNISNYNDLKEVKQKIYDYYKDDYISTEQISKPITNIDTGLKIEIWKNGIMETFGNASYYKNLSITDKKIKLATMDSLAKMIKYGEIRANSATNYHNSNSTAEYYYLEHPITIDGNKYMVNMDIRKVPNYNGRFYIHSIDTKKVGTPGTSKKSPLMVPTNDNNIPQNNKNVKSGTSTMYSMQENINNTQELDNSSFSLKQKQLEIIQNNNPVQDDYHTWIRNINDIKTLEETLNDGDWSDYDEFNPDLTRNDIQNAINKGKITVYSSYPIEQGIFVSPSKMEAESYSGNGKIYSKKVNINDIAWIDPTQGQYAKVQTFNEDIRHSQENKTWQEYLDKHYKPTGTRTNMQNNNNNTNKIMNPNEISQLTPESANTTPKLPTKNVSTGNGESHFVKNIENKTNMLTKESKAEILDSNEVKYYQEVTNKGSLEKAFSRLNEGGESETLSWLNKKSENATDIDVAEGWILLKQYQDSIQKTDDLIEKDQLNRSMVQVAKKMREMGTKAGQTVQAYNILNRLTPEGMVYYAQSELSEAFEIMSKNKTKEWIDVNKEKFNLTPQETEFIMKTMQEVQQMEDGYDKRVKLAEIQKVMTDKLPPTKGAGIKAWMRISMLFNPKTQVRNVMGNAIIAPVNAFSDIFASGVDKLISKKTGIRTTGNLDIKSYAKGFRQGAYQSYNDFKKGINTRNIEGNRFEITEGKSFNDNNPIGKRLNKVDSLLSFMLDAGDRTFYEATFTNSINNQLVLNNKTEITQDMIDIATSEALSRTWQDNNGYTRFVLNTRKGLNAISIKGYGLGDILIPFAKTPANLTKAIIDYSPAGLISTINSGINLKRSLSNGQYNAQMQHQFVQNLGKATAGTMLYVLGIALANAGITSGESDDDKDVANFMKNTLGISSYSIKIGNKSFTYDWAQPVAAPLAITANIIQKQKDGASLKENIMSSLDTAGNILLEQSFLESLNTVLSNNEGIATGIQEAVLELPSRAIPTFMKQIVDLIDGTQRQTFEKDKPLETAINKVKAKLPGLSQSLAPSVDTMGREIQKYGGKNNLFNVFLNPANINTENISTSAKEIYRLYKSTGDATIMPRVAPYDINQNGEKILLTSNQREEYQKISGDIIETSIKQLLNKSDYKNMNDIEKASIVNKIIGYSYNKARQEVLNIEMSNQYNKINQYINDGGKVADYYLNKEEIDYSYNNPEKYATIKQITNYKNYLNYQSDIDDLKEKYTDSNQRKSAVIQYINSLNLSIPQKAMLIKLNYSSYNKYNQQIISYINSQNITKDEKIEILTKLGFTIRNGRVYS